MNSKAIICGVVVAAISTFVMSRAHAQAQDVPAVKIISTDEPDVIKVIYAYSATNPVNIKFTDADGLIFEETIKGRTLDNGFMKKYNVGKIKGDAFWVQLDSQEFSIKFIVTSSKDNKLTAQLETVTHNFPVLALN